MKISKIICILTVGSIILALSGCADDNKPKTETATLSSLAVEFVNQDSNFKRYLKFYGTMSDDQAMAMTVQYYPDSGSSIALKIQAADAAHDKSYVVAQSKSGIASEGDILSIYLTEHDMKLFQAASADSVKKEANAKLSKQEDGSYCLYPVIGSAEDAEMQNGGSVSESSASTGHIIMFPSIFSGGTAVTDGSVHTDADTAGDGEDGAHASGDAGAHAGGEAGGHAAAGGK